VNRVRSAGKGQSSRRSSEAQRQKGLKEDRKGSLKGEEVGKEKRVQQGGKKVTRGMLRVYLLFRMGRNAHDREGKQRRSVAYTEGTLRRTENLESGRGESAKAMVASRY